MSKTAYLLIEAEPGLSFNVIRGLRELAEVTGADFVSGPYDIIAQIAVEDVNAIGRLITEEVHPLQGVVRTVTCISIA
jgi:DNA-binding Lrp family transcriptional regulator